MKHTTDNCYGKVNKLYYACRFCNSYQHVGAMCQNRPIYVPKGTAITKVCLNMGVEDSSNFLLPVFSIVMEGPSGTRVKFNVLLDTGSSRTYISSYIANKLNFNVNKLNKVEYEVKTFLKNENKAFREATVQVNLPSGRYNVVPILVDEDFDLEIKIRNLKTTISSFKSSNLKLAAEFEDASDTVFVHGLVRADIIQFIGELRVVKCLHGSAFAIASDLIPYGNISHFLF